MRRYFLTAVPMMLLLSLLTGCGGKEMMQQALDFRTSLLECEQYSFTADLTANYDDRVYDFTLECVGTPSGDMSMTVTAPDTISGISATVKNDCRTIEFDGLSLEFGPLADGRVSLICGPALLGACWASEYIDSTGKDEEQTIVVYRKGYEQEEVVVRCWFDTATALPQYAEIWCGDAVVLSAELSNFSIQ